MKELEKMRKSLISRVSHELKTPLMSIRGVTELFMGKHQYDLDQEDVDLLQILERGEKRLEELIKNLIDISRIEYNEVQLEKQYVDLSHLFKDCIFEMNHLINKKCLSLYLDIPSDLLLNIDPTRIEQVIINLLMNSIKNTPSNGKITIYGKKSPLKVEISICDTGIGLTEKEKEILFTRFGKIERNEEGLENISIQGAGLGLFISKNIIEMHGGNIWAESDGRNKGSKFIFTLPIKNNLKN
ncbi:MAG: HAMP domain-containing sensor histidine kinase [Candidatus Lokiarchaeota archaeon]